MSGLGLGSRCNSFASSSIQNHFLYTQLFSSSWTIPTHTPYTHPSTQHTHITYTYSKHSTHISHSAHTTYVPHTHQHTHILYTLLCSARFSCPPHLSQIFPDKWPTAPKPPKLQGLLRIVTPELPQLEPGTRFWLQSSLRGVLVQSYGSSQTDLGFNMVSSLWMCDQEELAYSLNLSFPICEVGMTASPTSQCCGENNMRPTKVLAPRELPLLLQRSILTFIRPHLLQMLLGTQAPSGAGNIMMIKTLSWSSESSRIVNLTIPYSQRRWH